ncbi:hypothetical protein CHLNCDRAFT_57709 [Chlorella variabilis]|uniref:PHD-type domain-containing protein n=1 Tax=Chlorella variabilis TaxID=554065 RepID=E1ZE13_CHLVA|nr:hypothetical protein CHLNCDRAFT_57709 [Chlorella variabilis]EFN55790.1 hypothetical protein CHLNCDRAFT_57709 [Chlorella variabilis]|eukprot:XP_005847892.1 hypothetical protein CHLNCDRAFT_57709 [Chlorella variabilis]
MAATELYGKLIIVGKEGCADLEFPLDKKSILIGRQAASQGASSAARRLLGGDRQPAAGDSRDHSCDIRIVNKEISRKHAEVYVEDNGAVFISSMGREPVAVNGAPVTSPLELATGDKIEVLLENRTRVFYFQGDDETVQIRAPPARPPLADANAALAAVPAAKPAAKGDDGPARRPAPPPASARSMAAVMQDAIKAGVQLKKVQVASTKPTPRAVTAGGMFVPTPADLLKLKAGLRKTAAGPAAAKLEEEAAAPVQAQGADDAAAAEAPAGPDAQLVDAEAMETEEAAAVVEEPNVPLAADLAAAEPATEAVEATAGAGRPEAAPVAAEEAQAAVEEPATEQPAVAAAEPAAAPPEVGGDAAMPDTAAPQAAETAAAEEPLAAVDDAAAAASEAAGVPGSVMRKRKSVRFHVEETAQQRVAGTPEGSARDATITIRLRKGDIEQARPGCRLAGAGRRWFQIINVDDNTVALAQWGLGTMGEPVEELPDTVVSKRSRHSTAAPFSASKTPVRSMLQELLAGSPAVSCGAQATPGAMGPAAPAPTPASGAAQASHADGAGDLVLDPATLAAKLTEMAEQHDVTLEVPVEFFKSPATTGKDGLRVVLTPKSKGKTPGASTIGQAQDTAPASAAKSAPRTTGRSRLSQVGASLAPPSACAAASTQQDTGLEKTREVQVPEEVLLAVEAAAQASARKQSASRRRSLSRTPGTKIVIIEQTTPASARAASGAKRPTAEAACQATPRLLSTIAVQTEAEDCGDDVEQERSDEGGSVEDDSLELEEAAAEQVPLKQYQRAVLRAKAYHAEARQLAAQLRRMTAKAAKLKKAATALSGALDEERGKRQELQEAMQQVVLNRAAEEEEAAAAEEAAAEGAEVEMQDAEEEAEMEEEQAAGWVPRVIVLGKLSTAASTAQRAGQVVVVRPSQAPAAAAVAQAPAPEVVVLPASARTTPAPSAAKCARMPVTSAAKRRTPAIAARAAGATPAVATQGKRPAAATQGKTPGAASAANSGGVPELPKSMLKEAPGTEGGARVVLENVELPGWLFEGEQQAPEVAAAAAVAAEVEAAVAVPDEEASEEHVAAARAEAAAEEEEEQQREAIVVEAGMDVDGSAAEQVQGLAQEAAAEAISDAEEGEEGEADFCHLCGQSDEGDILLLCDSCDNACHLSCCNPPFKRVPKGDWFCVECAAKQAAEAAAAAQATKPAAKRGAKRPTEEAEEALPAKPAGRGRRGAAAVAPAAEAAEEAPVKGGRGRGSKRAAEQQPAAAAESEQPLGRGKRGRPASKPSEEPAPSGRTARGKAAASEEVSTRRGRGATAPKAEAPASIRSTRSRR